MRFAAMLAILIATAGGAHAYPTVYFEPEALLVTAGEPCSLAIRIDSGTDTLTCFLVEFSFDADVVQLNSAEEGSLFSESGLLTMFDWDVIGPGHHQCNDVTLGFDSFVMCPGELVHLEFSAAQPGTTTITIEDVDLRDIRRDPILPVGMGTCRVTVDPGTGVPDGHSELRTLHCSPNPFSSQLRMEFRTRQDAAPIAESEDGVSFRILDPSGRVVARPEPESMLPGAFSAVWDGGSSSGKELPAGVYFVEARRGKSHVRARVTLLR